MRTYNENHESEQKHGKHNDNGNDFESKRKLIIDETKEMVVFKTKNIGNNAAESCVQVAWTR